MGYGMKYTKGGFPFKSPAKQKVDPDAPGTPGTPGFEPPVTSMDYLTKIPNPTTRAVKNKDYKIDEKEEQVIENMSNTSNFDGQTEMEINKLKKKTNKQKASNKKRSDAEKALEVKEDAEGK